MMVSCSIIKKSSEEAWQGPGLSGDNLRNLIAKYAVEKTGHNQTNQAYLNTDNNIMVLVYTWVWCIQVSQTQLQH